MYTDAESSAGTTIIQLCSRNGGGSSNSQNEYDGNYDIMNMIWFKGVQSAYTNNSGTLELNDLDS